MSYLTDAQIEAFQQQGYLVIPAMLDGPASSEALEVSREHAALNLAPLEYEVDVQYPGSPSSLDAQGGGTIRRLLNAYSRHECFRNWATSAAVKGVLAQLFRGEDINLSQCHHNCIMTKHPGFSSATSWHQDNRYWSFDAENLISCWLALGDETLRNGCLRVIPQSHRLSLAPGRFDAALFLRPDLAENDKLIESAVSVELKRGDVLFFHSRLFHAAGRNLTDQVKYSLVYTYHETNNRPIRETRSARFPGIRL